MIVQPRFKVGTTFRTRGKHPRECVVTDFLVTTNLAVDIARFFSSGNFDTGRSRATAALRDGTADIEDIRVLVEHLDAYLRNHPVRRIRDMAAQYITALQMP